MKKRFSRELIAASSRQMVLSILEGRDSYGYEILNQVKVHSSGELEWSDGMLYPVLHRLERDGLIAGNWQVTGKGRPRKYYSLTERGRAQLETDRKDWRTVAEALDCAQGMRGEHETSLSPGRARSGSGRWPLEHLQALMPLELHEPEGHIRPLVAFTIAAGLLDREIDEHMSAITERLGVMAKETRTSLQPTLPGAFSNRERQDREEEEDCAGGAPGLPMDTENVRVGPLPRKNVASDADEVQRTDPDYLSRVIQYTLIRRAMSRPLKGEGSLTAQRIETSRADLVIRRMPGVDT